MKPLFRNFYKSSAMNITIALNRINPVRVDGQWFSHFFRCDELFTRTEEGDRFAECALLGHLTIVDSLIEWLVS